jgi:hypothetical protein
MVDVEADDDETDDTTTDMGRDGQGRRWELYAAGRWERGKAVVSAEN